MNRTASRRSRLIASIAFTLLVLAPAGVAQADPDTNIQKPGHIAIAGS